VEKEAKSSEEKELRAHFPLIRQGLHRKRRVQQLFYCCTFIRCHGNVFTDPLPNNDKGMHIHTDRWEGFMKNTIEMGSGAMKYILSRVYGCVTNNNGF
jgi:hypothetical protein